MAALSSSGTLESSIVEISAWPGAEDTLPGYELPGYEEWEAIVESPGSSSVLLSDEWEKASLVKENLRLTNQVEVLAALAGRPCSGLAISRATMIQCAARGHSGRLGLKAARSAATQLQQCARGWAARAYLEKLRRSATSIQSQQRAILARRAADTMMRNRAAALIQRAVRTYRALLMPLSKTQLRREALAARRRLAEVTVRNHAALDNVVAAHAAAASRARKAEAQVAEVTAQHAAELQQLCNAFEERQDEGRRVHAAEKQGLLDEIAELVAQVAGLGSENLRLQNQASELLVEKLQGWT
uniref:Uncharacterized protein n=1 Tax=Haptolina ericina TaxID=156174 RepID=A0A7S3EUK5_9EUKA